MDTLSDQTEICLLGQTPVLVGKCLMSDHYFKHCVYIFLDTHRNTQYIRVLVLDGQMLFFETVETM